MYRMLKEDTAKPPVCTVTAQQKKFDRFRLVFNHERPHEALANETPESLMKSVFRLTKQAGKHMLAQGSGKVINIGSLLTFQGGIIVPSYAAAKGGVGQLTKAFANEWASKGINVNAIGPGYMQTDNTEALRANAERSRQILDRIPAAGRDKCRCRRRPASQTQRWSARTREFDEQKNRCS
jgi:NAD(P)-dependent dehydrogenase (short-subunit alcohol dehydrogenase family)